jgi:putative ABC transport system permease protein
MSTLEVRQGVRRLRHSPLYTLSAILTLGFGIGAATAAFAVVDAVLVRSLPFRDPASLVWVWATRTDRDRAFFSIPDFVDVARRARTLHGIAGVAPWGVNLTDPADGRGAERLAGARVTPGALSLLGVRAAHGRSLTPEDDPHAVVVSERLWRRRFASDPSLLGRSIVLDGESYAVVGILASSFQLPNVDTDVVASIDLAADPRHGQRGSNFLRAFARLAPGVSPAQAHDELAGIAHDLGATFPETDAKIGAPRVVPLEEELVGGHRAMLALLAGAILAVFAVACASFAGLALARMAARRQELAVRIALGATRARLARLFLVESALLAAMAGGLGALAAPWLVALFRALAPPDLPRVAEIAVGPRALAFSVAAAIACALLVGLFPALRAPAAATRAPGVGTRHGLRAALTVAQFAVSLVLLAGAGLLARAAARVAATDPGFDPAGVTAVRFSLPRGAYASPQAIATFLRRVAARAAELPAVDRAAAASYLPLSGANARTDFLVVGRPPASAADTPGAQWRFVGPDYFATLGIPVRRGRAFTAADDGAGQPVVVVDEALARRFLDGAEPVGAHLVLDDGVGQRDVEIVGVAGNVAHFRLEDGPSPTIYVPLEQVPPAVVGAIAANASLVVRARGSVPALADLVAGLDRGVAASPPRSMGDVVAGSLAARRLAVTLVGGFAAMALLLAALGLTGLVASSVADRTREIGVRMALGGSAQTIVRSIVRDAARLLAAGVILGTAGAVAVARVAAVGDAGDPVPFLGGAVVLCAVGLAAAWIPARRAASVDPMVALRG